MDLVTQTPIVTHSPALALVVLVLAIAAVIWSRRQEHGDLDE